MISRIGGAAVLMAAVAWAGGCKETADAKDRPAAASAVKAGTDKGAAASGVCPVAGKSGAVNTNVCPAMPEHASTNAAGMDVARFQEAAGPTVTGKVLEVLEASRYTYVLVESGTNGLWAAAPRFAVKKGDSVVVPTGMPMENFHSSTLNRSFDVLYMSAKIPVVPPANPAK